MSGSQASSPRRRDLTASQSLIWMSQQLSPEIPLFNMAHRFEFNTAVEPRAFKQSLQWLVDNSDALKTIFVESGASVEQRVLERMEITLWEEDFSGHEDPDAEATAWMAMRAGKMFDLEACAHESRY